MSSEEFKIESVDRYYYFSGRNGKNYVEVTFWYNPVSLERKETKRSESIYTGQEYQLPDWAKSITERRRGLESLNMY